MARLEFGPVVYRGEADSLISVIDIAERVSNFKIGPENSLVPVSGPAPYVPSYGAGLPTYDTVHGVFQGEFGPPDGRRELILAHVGSELWEFLPHKRIWRTVIGSGGQLGDALPDTADAQFPTQFEVVDSGVVICPKGHFPLFYDGRIVSSLGYNMVPPAPTQLYRHNLLGLNKSRGGASLTYFGNGVLGTVETSTSGDGSKYRRRAGSILYKYAWIDEWGNSSPLSSPLVVRLPYDTDPNDPDRTLSEVGLGGVAVGRKPTRGRQVYRSLDVINQGTLKLFEIIKAGSPEATISDNVSSAWTDAIDNGELGAEAPEYISVPQARLARLGNGRLWLANSRDEPGLLAASEVGRYGTFAKSMKFYPDASGGQITGIWRHPVGMLITSPNALFLASEGDQGGGYRVEPIQSDAGSDSPSTFASLPTGEPIWLSSRGFMLFDGQKAVPISRQIEGRFRRLNHSRLSQAVAAVDPRTGEYRCWVPSQGSTDNDLCLVFDGQNWRERDGEIYRSICVTNTRPNRMIAGGKINSTEGVWVVDHADPTYTQPSRQYVIETSWIGSSQLSFTTGLVVHIWLRERTAGSIQIDAFRDYRYGEVVSNPVMANQATARPPSSWSRTTLGSSARWMRRGVFKTKVSIGIPGCEVFKIRMASSVPYEPIAISYDIAAHSHRGRGEGA